MSSSLRHSVTPSTAQPINTIHRSAIPSPPAKKQKMSITQTYMLATVARRQLQKEAARADHDLRLLVGHANLLDGLMLDLANAEQEQESWFNQSVNSAATASAEPKHVQWADSHPIPEEAAEDEMYDESDDDDDSEADEEIDVAPRAVRKVPQTIVTAVQEEEDQEMDDDFDEELTLTRSPSHSASPPELMLEDSEDSESEDDSMPPSPPHTEMQFSTLSPKDRQAIVTTSLYQSKSDDAPFFQPESQPVAIAAY